jgi:hypothetical protein
MQRLLLLALLPLASCQLLGGDDPLTGRRLAHDVFITLKDDSADACEGLARDCRDALSEIPTVLALDAGTRASAQGRDVNDIEFDVALHVIFKDAEGLEQYLVHPAHTQFVERMMPNVDAVRVFDSWVR